MTGKGSRPRKIKDYDKFAKAWDKIFGTKEKEKKKNGK
jgi:hypothetical protein